MPLGESAGRSRGNRNGDGATRRNTQRERAYIDPVFPDGPPEVRFQRDPGFRLTARGHRVLDLALWSLWTIFCVVFAVVICAWWGLV